MGAIIEQKKQKAHDKFTPENFMHIVKSWMYPKQRPTEPFKPNPVRNIIKQGRSKKEHMKQEPTTRHSSSLHLFCEIDMLYCILLVRYEDLSGPILLGKYEEKVTEKWEIQQKQKP